MMKKVLFVLCAVILIVVSCKPGSRKSAEQSAGETFKQFSVTEVWKTDTLLRTPESVIYDKARNVIYVADMNLEPRKKDANGFISRIGTDGIIRDLHWIDGLHSPKGLAIVGDTLYTADVDEVVAIDINKGVITKKYSYPGMKMLNDITSAPDGSLYISDTDGNVIYMYKNGKLTPWLNEGLSGPNGVLYDGTRLLIASQGSNDFASVEFETKIHAVLTDSTDHGDGIALTSIPGYYLVSEWGGQVYVINPDYSKVSIINTKANEINSADIDYIPEMNLLLVPTFFKNSLVAYKVTVQ